MAQGAFGFDNDPLGTLVWTDYDGSSWRVKFHVFMPSLINKPDSLNWKGVFKYDGEALDGGDKFAYMHPAFDYTGVRLLWSSGQPILPNLSPSLELEQPETKIKKWEKDEVFVDSAAAFDYVFHPAPDHRGSFLYFNKYLAEGDFDGGPGIHIYRVDYEDGGNESLVVENALYPSISLNDRIMVFVRQLPNENQLPETPIAMGVYYVEIDPETGETTMDPELITPALGDVFQGCLDGTAPGQDTWRGPIRCGKAAIGPDEKKVIFALQDCRFGTGDPSWNLWQIPDLESPGIPERIGVSEEDAKGWDDFWPSISSDGNWVAHMRKLRTDLRESRVVVTNIETGESREPDDLGDIALWPHFDQDNDVPNLEVRLFPGDSNDATFIKFTELEPDVWDGSQCKDNFKLYFEGANFTPGMSEKFEPSTTAELQWTKDELPAKLELLLSTKEAFEKDDHRVYTDFGDTSDYESVDGEPIEALYLEEGERLKIEILARDGRYLRPNTGDIDPEQFRWGQRSTNYHDRSWESSQSPTVQGRNVDPPYFPRVSKEAVDERYPGLTWWVEDMEGEAIPRTDSAFYHIFRKANYPHSITGGEEKPYYLRIVAQDLWMNKIDILIPVFVWDKKSRIDALEYGSKKNR